MHRWLLLVLGLGWVLLPAAPSAQAAEKRTTDPPATRDQSPDLVDVVERLISHTNAFRQQEGRPTAKVNPQLTATAQDFATFMARTV